MLSTSQAISAFAELPGNPNELCPSNPETLTFIKSLWEEVLAVHQGCEIAHLGGDGVPSGIILSALRPACAGTLGGLYTDYYHALETWFIEQGIRPIAGDMILMYPETLKRLPHETIFAIGIMPAMKLSREHRFLFVAWANFAERKSFPLTLAFSVNTCAPPMAIHHLSGTRSCVFRITDMML